MNKLGNMLIQKIRKTLIFFLSLFALVCYNHCAEVPTPPSSPQQQQTKLPHPPRSFLNEDSPDFLTYQLEIATQTLQEVWKGPWNSNSLAFKIREWLTTIAALHSQNVLSSPTNIKAIQSSLHEWRKELFFPLYASSFSKMRNGVKDLFSPSSDQINKKPIFVDPFDLQIQTTQATSLQRFQRLTRALFNALVSLETQYPQGSWMTSFVGQPLSSKGKKSTLAQLVRGKVNQANPFQESLPSIASQKEREATILLLKGELQVFQENVMSFKNAGIQIRAHSSELRWVPLHLGIPRDAENQPQLKLTDFITPLVTLFFKPPLLPIWDDTSMPRDSLFLALNEKLGLPPLSHFMTRIALAASSFADACTLDQNWFSETQHWYYPGQAPKVVTLSAQGSLQKWFLIFQAHHTGDLDSSLPPVLLTIESACHTPATCFQMTSRLTPFVP